MMRSNPGEREDIVGFWESQWPDDPIVHLEKAAAECVGSMEYEIWDLHAESGRWWIVTNPINLYSQDDFKSRDVVLTFHIGLSVRVTSQTRPVTEEAATVFPSAWRRWEQSLDTLRAAREAEDYQAIGMRLRECLIAAVEEFADDDLVPEGTERPQAANVKAWIDLYAGHMAPGPSAAKLRSHIRAMGNETWNYVNWLTHARSATYFDSEIALGATSHLLATLTGTAMRTLAGTSPRCRECASYAVIVGKCRACGWINETFVPSTLRAELSPEELAARLAEPCTPCSDISTFITPDQFGQHP